MHGAKEEESHSQHTDHTTMLGSIDPLTNIGILGIGM